MNREFCLKGLFLATAVAAAAPSGAGVVSTMVGQANSFGIVDADLNPVSLADGSTFDNLGVATGVDADGNLDALGLSTDLLYTNTVELSFSHILPGAMQSAKLRLFTAGWGLYGRAQVYFNGNLLAGGLSDGDGRSLDPMGQETAQLDVFDIDLAWITGNDRVRIEVAQSAFGIGPDFIDFGAVDFAALDITTQDTGGTLPEPSGIVLAALGLAAAASRRRLPGRGAEGVSTPT